MKAVKKLVPAFILVIAISVTSFYLYATFSDVPLLNENSRVLLYDNQNQVFYESNYFKNSTWCNFEDFPTLLTDAVVAVEDKRFYSHLGIDPIRIIKAFAVNLISGSIEEGASTITQQYARNLYLSLDQTYSRKLREIIIATKMEMHYSKQDILEGYLNTVYFGHGIYGFAKAADFFFDKNLNECSIGEIAMLVGIPNGPSYYSPFINLKNSKSRQKIVLNAMAKNGVITQDEADQAWNDEIHLAELSEKNIKQIDGYYVDAVIQELRNLNLYTEENIKNGLEVYTYYDNEVQKTLQESIQKHDPNTGQEIAGVILQPFTFHVLAINGGKDYTTSQYNRILYSTRQIGSTLKPLLYYCALADGFTPSTTFLSSATSFQISEDEVYTPTNFLEIYPETDISMINAIACSDNIYAIKTHLFLGTDLLNSTLNAFGIELTEENISIALGSTNFPLIDLAKIYNTFASEGLVEEPSFIRLVCDAKGNILYENKDEPKQLLKRDETLILTSLLRSPYDIKNITGSTPSMLGYEPYTMTAVKSGTSDWDSLVASYNPNYTMILWTGYDDNKAMTTSEERRVVKEVFQDFYNTLYPKGEEGPWYAPSANIEARRVDPISGQLSINGSLYWYKRE